MTRNNGGAMTLATTIEGILNHGAGPMNIPLDDIRVELRKQPMRSSTGWKKPTLDEAREFIDRHLSTALDILGEHGWSSAKTTQNWEDAGYPDPGTLTELEIKRFLAGIGRASAAVGLHFTLDEDDWLWVYARAHGGSVWRGKRNKEYVRLTVEAQNGRLTTNGLAVAEGSAASPRIGDKKFKSRVRDVKKALNP
jgi:hypothetical protein